MHRQQTIAEKVSCTGIGLHSGAPVQLTLLPARAGTGIVIVRNDRGRTVEIPARASAVHSTAFATTLGEADDTVATVEHLLAAFYGLGIDNARVQIEGPEMPRPRNKLVEISDPEAWKLTHETTTVAGQELKCLVPDPMPEPWSMRRSIPCRNRFHPSTGWSS